LYLRGRHFWYWRTEEGIRKSIECFEEALRHDPSLAVAYDGISDAHTMLACRGMTPAVESFHKAKAAARQAVRMQPKNLADEAVEAMRQAVAHSQGSTEALLGLAQAHAVSGDKLAMVKIVKELSEGGHRYVSPYNVARVYVAIGDKEEALKWLERAYQEHNPDLIELTREPSFGSLRSDAKFRELAKRIGWHRVSAD
jgi:tetratricopeptide (TPR) repeat protein